MQINIGGVRFTTFLRQPCDMTSFVNRAYCIYDYGCMTKFMTTICIRYDSVRE